MDDSNATMGAPQPSIPSAPIDDHEALRVALLSKVGRAKKPKTIKLLKGEDKPAPAVGTPEREEWSRERHNAKERARGRLAYPDPATPAQARKNIEALVKEAATLVVKDMPAPKLPIAGLSESAKANCLAILGEDIDATRKLFADKLTIVANAALDRIYNEIDDMPYSSLPYTVGVLADKAENMRIKQAVTAKGAAVQNQINLFPSDIDKEKLIATLMGKFQPDRVEQAKPVEVQAEPVAN